MELLLNDDPSCDMSHLPHRALGLRATLQSAVHAIIRQSEDEPYGVRGACVVVKLSSDAGGERDLGTIAFDRYIDCWLLRLRSTHDVLSLIILKCFDLLTGAPLPLSV